MKCNQCGRETQQTIQGLCGGCYVPFPPISINYVPTGTLSTWQCPFCKIVYTEYVMRCECQVKIEKDKEKTKC